MFMWFFVHVSVRMKENFRVALMRATKAPLLQTEENCYLAMDKQKECI